MLVEVEEGHALPSEKVSLLHSERHSEAVSEKPLEIIIEEADTDIESSVIH